MAIIKKTLFADNLDKYNTFVTDTDPLSKYFKLTELPDTFTGGKNAFLIQGSEYLVADSLIKIELKDSKGDIIYHEPGEGIVSASVNGEPIVTEYYEGVSKVVSVYIYPDTAYGPSTITILGELASYDNNGINTPIPANWEGSYNVKWQKEINVVPSLANDTRIRFYRRPTASISEILNPIYSFVGDTKVASAVTQSFANIKLSNLETFAGDVKRVKVFRTSIGDISDYDLIQDILVESKELLTTDELTGSVVGNTGIFTSEVLKTQWNTGSLNAFLTSSRVEAGVRLTGSGLFIYTQSLDLKSTNTYELNLDVFYSSSTDSNLGIYLVSGSTSSSIATLAGTQPTKNLLDTTIPFKIDRDFPTASLYFSQSQGEWHLGNISLKLSEDTAFSPDEIGFITTMPTVLGNETFNFKFEFYDINNNYVPVEVTQSATFTGGNTNIGGTILLISSSTSQSLADLNRVSSSISGTVTNNSSSVSGSLSVVSGSVVTLSGSVSGSIVTLSGSVSGTIGVLSGSVSGTIGVLSGSVSSSITSLSSSVSASISNAKADAFAKVQLLANGGYPGTFIENNLIYSPVIGGQLGYFSELFKVGTTPSIYLDARQNPRKIFIGGIVNPSDTVYNEYSGAFNNTNTNVYLDSTGKFSLGNKLSYDGTNLSVNGSITVTGGNAETTSGAQSKADTAISTAASDATTKANNAKNDAISTAAGDATTKANNAKNDAIATASSDATSKSNAAFASAAAQVKSLADGGYTGAFISSTTIFAPVIGGTIGYFSNQFRVGDAGIVLDGVDKRIYIGSGTYGNANTGFYVDSTGNFSLGNKLSFNGSVLSINGSGTFSGDISAATGTFAGGITATTGTIGGWSIDSNSIFRGTKGSDGAYTAGGGSITFGSGWISSAKFYINSSGDAAFKGDITGASGTFSGNLSGATITGATGTFAGSISGASGTIGGVTLDGSGITFGGGTGQLNASGLNLSGNLTVGGGGGIDFGTYGFFTSLRGDAMFTPRIRLYQNTGGSGSDNSLSFDFLYSASGLTTLGVDSSGYVKKVSSSRKYKKEINPIPLESAKRILDLNIISFKDKDAQVSDTTLHSGLIAEEVSDLGYTDWVIYDNSGSVDGVYYQSIFASMVKVVQDLNKRVEELEAKISGSI